jgi:hypothetical protein
MKGVHAYEDFYANCDHMPGAERALRIGGRIVFRTTGWSARLEPTEGNDGINPKMLHLDLVFTPPEEGSGQTDVLTPYDLEEWPSAPPAAEYDEVEFHVRGSDDDPPPVLKVVHTE